LKNCWKWTIAERRQKLCWVYRRQTKESGMLWNEAQVLPDEKLKNSEFVPDFSKGFSCFELRQLLRRYQEFKGGFADGRETYINMIFFALHTGVKNIQKLQKIFHNVCSLVNANGIMAKKQNKQTPLSESTSELYRPSDRCFSTKLMPIFPDRGGPRGQSDGSLRPYSWFSRPEPLLPLSSSSSIVLTRLSRPRSRPATSQKIW
jgi:hypothetical protein